MNSLFDKYQPVVATILALLTGLFLLGAGPVAAQSETPDDMDALFVQLQDEATWPNAESDILRAWSRSGSASMDLLLQRGEAALDAGDLDAAIGHLTALTDHAPGFATGWQARATAYYMSGLYGPAAADLAQAVALEPRQFVALTQLGTMLEEIGDQPRALVAYRELLKIHPFQQEALDGVARLEKELDGSAI